MSFTTSFFLMKMPFSCHILESVDDEPMGKESTMFELKFENMLARSGFKHITMLTAVRGLTERTSCQ